MSSTASYEHQDPARCDDSGICEGRNCQYATQGILHLNALVGLETGDGAMSVGSAVANPIISPGPVANLPLHAELDLSNAQGTLRLARVHPGPTKGRLMLDLYARPEGIRGSLQPILSPAPSVDPSNQSDAAAFRRLAGHWPAEDDCALAELPVDDQSDIGRRARALFDEYYPQLLNMANQTSVAGNWRGPPPDSVSLGSAELSFELPNDTLPLCTPGDGTLSLSTQMRVTSADGTVDWTTTVQCGIRSGQGNGSISDPPYLGVGVTRFFSDADALRGAALGDVDLFGGTAAEVRFSAEFMRSLTTWVTRYPSTFQASSPAKRTPAAARLRLAPVASAAIHSSSATSTRLTCTE
jgi:hypothetical protein